MLYTTLLLISIMYVHNANAPKYSKIADVDTTYNNKIAKVGLEYYSYYWPTQQEFENYRISIKSLPDSIIKRATYYLKLSLSNDLIPPDIEKRYIALKDLHAKEPGARSAGGVADYIIAHWKVNDIVVQMKDDGTKMGIFIIPSADIERVKDKKEYAISSLQKYLNYPKIFVDSLQVMYEDTNSVNINGISLVIGYKNYIEPKEEDENQTYKPFWWNYIRINTNGREIYYEYSENDGSTREFRRYVASPIHPLRFPRTKKEWEAIKPKLPKPYERK